MTPGPVALKGRTSRAGHATNLLLGLSVLSWAVLGLTALPPEQRYAPVRFTIVALHLTVGVLFVTRGALVRGPRAGHVLAAIPALIAGGWALYVAPPLAAWPWPATVLFAAGGGLAIVALIVLGRCFAVFPAVRGVKTGWPF